MSYLSVEAAELIKAYRTAVKPSAMDRERVLQMILPQLGGSPPATEVASPSGGGGLVAAKLTFVKSLAVIAGLGLAGAGVYVATNLDRTPALEKTTVVASKSPAQETPMPVQEALPSAEPLGPHVEAVKPAFAPSHASDNLAQEVAILSRASAELHAGQPASALVALDEHQKLFPTGVLAEERIAARVQVYCALGRIKEAKQELAQLAQLSPNSPHEARARKACGFKLSDGE